MSLGEPEPLTQMCNEGKQLHSPFKSSTGLQGILDVVAAQWIAGQMMHTGPKRHHNLKRIVELFINFLSIRNTVTLLFVLSLFEALSPIKIKKASTIKLN